MRFLLDASLSPRLGEALTAAGYQVRHVVDIGFAGACGTQTLTAQLRTATW